MLEWQYSSIPLSWPRFPVYFCIQSCYILVSVSASIDEELLYNSLHWTKRPTISTIVVAGVFIVYTLVFLTIKTVTDIKLTDTVKVG